MGPEMLSGGSSRRSARLPIHGNRAARRTTGLEPALLVAKVTKIEERRENIARHQPKDGLDVLRRLRPHPPRRWRSGSRTSPAIPSQGR